MDNKVNNIQLVAEEGASLSSGSLRLYYLLPSPRKRGAGGEAQAVGAIDLYAYDPLNRRCAVGIMVATEYRRQGHALAMLRALQSLYSPRTGVPQCTPANDPMCSPSSEAHRGVHGGTPVPRSAEGVHGGTPLHSLYADIAVTNTASIALFAKAGYRQCGLFKEWLEYDGHFIDSIRMQLILK